MHSGSLHSTGDLQWNWKWECDVCVCVSPGPSASFERDQEWESKVCMCVRPSARLERDREWEGNMSVSVPGPSASWQGECSRWPASLLPGVATWQHLYSTVMGAFLVCSVNHTSQQQGMWSAQHHCTQCWPLFLGPCMHCPTILHSSTACGHVQHHWTQCWALLSCTPPLCWSHMVLRRTPLKASECHGAKITASVMPIRGVTWLTSWKS